jgi:septal ring factor EnvC (AmiA/AmiB activator)
MLGITAAAVVGVGGWIGTTITTLNQRFAVLETEMTQIRKSMAELASDAKQTRAEVIDLRERVIKLEIQRDNTRVDR